VEKEPFSRKGDNMEHQYEVFVIGTGTAGYTLAHKCRKAGKKVAVADSRPMGGTCAMRGCQPKKYLATAAETTSLTLWMADIGISPAAEIDWPKLMQSKNNFTDRVPDRVEKSFVDAGIDVYHGTVRFLSPQQVKLAPETRIRAENIVIATGSTPSSLHIRGEEHVITSEEFLNLPSLPQRIIFIGGGYVSMEFAHVARAAGAEVTVLGRNIRVLKRFEPELVQQLRQSAEESGINIVTGYKVCEVQKNGHFYTVSGDESCRESYTGDLVVHGAGRIAALEALELVAGGVEYSHEGVKVNEYLQSVSNPRVYAIGDAVAKSAQLSPLADMEAEVAADNILEGNRTKPDYSVVPSVVFSIPPLAGVGMTEAEAVSSGLRFQVKSGSMVPWASSRRIGQKYAYYKVLVAEESGLILGAHILGYRAEEIINVFALAMKFDLTASDMQKVLWAYPTYTSGVKYMIE